MTASLPSTPSIVASALALCLLVAVAAWRHASWRAWLATLPTALGAAVVGSLLVMLVVRLGPAPTDWAAAMLPLAAAALFGWTWPLLTLREARRGHTLVASNVTGQPRRTGVPSGHEAGA